MTLLPQAYTEQDIKNELETQEDQIQINFSLETQVFLHYHYGSRNRRKLLKTVFRANVMLEKQLTDKTRHLSLKAVEIANAVLNKLVNGKDVLLSHEYLSKITECGTSKQNNNIIAQLSNLFDITPHNFLYRNGKVYRHNIEFKLKASILEEAKSLGALISEFNWKKISSPINNNNISSNRSKIDHRANPSQNSNSKAKSNISSIDTKKEQVELSNKTEPVVEQKKVKTFRPSNKRKKATNAQRAAKIYQLPPQFDKPKTLAELKPITQEECAILQSKSGREFTLNAQNQILQDMAKRLTRTFNSRWQFICYFSYCLRYEKRDAVACSGNNFYIKANMQEENILHNQQEQYLEEIEQISIKQPCPEHQFRAKLANTLERSTAYNLLLAMQSTLEVGNTFVISLNRQIELTERQKQVILSQVQAVFNSGGISENNQAIEKIQFMTDNQRFLHTIKKENNNQVSAIYNKVCSSSSNPVASSVYKDIKNKSELAETHRLELPKSNWGKVCAAFISEYGYELYKHWLESLSVEQTTTTIELSTSSGMVRDRIEQTYLPFLVKVAGEFGINKVEFVVC